MPKGSQALPAVSVVMAVHNAERYLREAVESVLDQTLSDLELLVIDDGSSDGGPRILAEYVSRDSRIFVHRQGNQGAAAARRRAFELARAPLVAILDADDIALPDRLERQRQFLAEHDAIAVVGGAVTFMDESGRPFADWQYPLADIDIREALPHTTPFAHSAVMLRKHAVHRVGGYRPILFPAEDADLWLRLAERYELANLPELVVRYRVHIGQVSVRSLELQTLCSVAARFAAKARLAGRPDPLETATRIDYETLLALGVTADEITSTFVHSTTGLAKMTGRAGYEDAAEVLFATAAARARSEAGSSALVADVYRERARRYFEQGRRMRATLETVRAVRAERARPPRLRPLRRKIGAEFE